MRQLAGLFLLFMSLPALAETAVRAIDGQTVELADGRQVALAGVTAPPDPAALDRLVRGRDVQVGPASPDRYGRLTAGLIRSDGLDIAAELLRSGAAQVFPPTLRNTELFAAEAAARQAGRGVWQAAETRIVTDTEAGKFTNSWRIVEGTVMAVSTFGGTTYVNFGPDHKTDFTLRLTRRLARKLQPEKWLNKKIRVRGWLSWRNGPEIIVNDVNQIK